mgnify:CR=1 FL=1
MSMPLISILIPAYNAGPYLRQTLESVLAQTVTDWECVIVDDASSDDTAAVAQAFVDQDARFKLHRVKPEEKQHHPASRNIALSLATGEWVSPLDADDWWEPWKLEKQLAAVNARPGIVLCACPTWVWENGKVVGRTMPINPQTVGRDLLATCVTCCSVLVKRQACLDAGGYDMDMLLAEDWDLWTRVTLMHGVDSVTAITEPCMYYRRHASNITSDTWRNIRYDRKVVRKLLFQGGLLRRHPRIALKLLDSQIVREMDNHIRGHRLIRARIKSCQMIALNPLKRWRWEYAGRAWRKAGSSDTARAQS